MVLPGRNAQHRGAAEHFWPEAAATLGCDCRGMIKTRVTCPPRREWHSREQTNGKVPACWCVRRAWWEPE